MKSKSVYDMRIGETAKIKAFRDECMGCKLLTMGMLPMSSISMIRKSPFGGAFYIKLENYILAIRYDEAKNIIIYE